ncbi:MAG TPA: IS200/IS605 family transposase [Luteibaculaceae bacterium]|nr:IS200/IS605 family transposase [Luteibaculaceae bacterium]
MALSYTQKGNLIIRHCDVDFMLRTLINGLNAAMERNFLQNNNNQHVAQKPRRGDIIIVTTFIEPSFDNLRQNRGGTISKPMANTYTQIFVHIVFAVKGRQNLIQQSWKDQLHKYICGIVNAKEQKVYAIGGVGDHIHILLSIKPHVVLSDLIRDIKANSSRWVNYEGLVMGKFQWQEGFGVFSCSKSQLDNVIGYINNQEQHHEKKTFREEYVAMLQQFGIEFDERFLFEWIE